MPVKDPDGNNHESQRVKLKSRGIFRAESSAAQKNRQERLEKRSNNLAIYFMNSDRGMNRFASSILASPPVDSVHSKCNHRVSFPRDRHRLQHLLQLRHPY